MGAIMLAPKCSHPNPTTCANLHDKKIIKAADGIKMTNPLTFK